MANEFIPERLAELNYESYLIIDQTGEGNFSDASSLLFVERSRESLERNKIIFENFLFDEDGSGSDAFTFGYKEKDSFIATIEETKPTCDVSDVSENNGAISVALKFGEVPFTYTLIGINETVYNSSAQTTSSRDFIVENIVSGGYELTVVDNDGVTVAHEVLLRSECEAEAEYPDDAPVFTYDTTNDFELITADDTDDTPDTTTDDVGEDVIAAYPIPVSNGEVLTITLDIEEAVTIQIVAPTGGIVLSQVIQPTGVVPQIVSFDIYTSPGIYFLTAYKANGDSLNTIKIIVY